MENLKIVYVANDMAASKAFERLNEILPGKAFLSFGGKNPLNEEEVVEAVQDADFVLIGMSNPPENTVVEVAAARAAVGAGTRFGFYSDTFGAYNRISFEPFREQASLVLVIAPGEDERGAYEIFPNAEVTCTYNPLWSDYFLPVSREEARKLTGATDDDFVILAAGENHAVMMIHFCSEVIEAASEIVQPDFPVRVVIAPHPGEKRITSEMYDQLRSFNEEFGITVMMIPDGVKTDQIIPGADVIVQRFNSSSGIHGICRRIPVIDFYTPMAQKFLKRISGSEEGYFVDSNAMIHIYPDHEDSDYDTLSEALLEARTGHEGVRDDMLRDQEQVIPHQEPGTAVANMKQAIEGLLAGK